ncbi:DUF4221 family protein [Bacteroides sp.]
MKVTNDSLVFELNPQTSMFIKALFPYTDKDGREFLTFQNNVDPQILVYDMNTQEYVHTITLDKEGPNSVGLFCGYNICSWGEIYIPCMMKNEIDIVDSIGTINRKIPYPEAIQGKMTLPFIVTSFPYSPLYIIGSKLYIPQYPNLQLGNRTIEDSPVTIVLDTVTDKLTEFAFRFPAIMISERILKNTLGVEFSYSSYFVENHFVYSFFFDEDIYVVSLDGKMERKVTAKSKYIDKISVDNKVPDLSSLAETLCKIPMYGNLIYDKYRDVYYRFVYPETALGPNENFMDIWQLGRTKFSIMILNKDLEVIGETLFPENTFASNLFFIREDGLYLSTSFVKNPNYSDDILAFKRIELVKE